jgi:hypothetical protein
LLIRGVLIALSGFLFIFAPGVPMGLLRRYGGGFPREQLYWGMGIWLVLTYVALLLQSLVRPVIQGAGATAGTVAMSLIGPILAALLVVGVMTLYLRWKGPAEDGRTEAGLTLGLGAGLIAQVFRGLDFVGGGLRLAYEGAGDPGLAPLAQAPMLDLIVALLAEILFRVAFLTVCGVVGILVARAVGGSRRSFWLAAAIYAGFSMLTVAIQLAVGGGIPGTILAGRAGLITSAVTAVFFVAAAVLAFSWIRRRLTADMPAAPARGRQAGRGPRNA